MFVSAVEESFVNATEGHMIGSDVCEIEPTSDTGELFRFYQSEYGRCVSSAYVDTEDGPRRIGWVFQGRDRYSDTGEPYLREVWITLLEKPDTIERTRHPAYL